MMNASSLYVTTSKLVYCAKPDDPGCITDVGRLLPYLRQSLSCTVCGNLLVEPFTPNDTNCQHHVCSTCRGGKKKLKPTCSWCKNYENYDENIQLRSLLQCYKKLCEYIIVSPIYRLLTSASSEGNVTDLIHEGAGFIDEFKSNAGLSKSAYSILPCIYSNTSTQTTVPLPLTEGFNADEISHVKQNGSSLYSVSYAGSGNKMVIKRKVEDDGSCKIPFAKESGFKRPIHRKSGKQKQKNLPSIDDKKNSKSNDSKKQRFGCRCGNATVTPGKLTCCGQRCPCYVVSKACLDCKCRGCRNPHTKEGQKVIRDVLDIKSEPTDEDLESDMLQMGLDDLSHLDHVLELRSDSSHHDLDLL